MNILPKELIEKLETSEYLTLNEREQLIHYIEIMEDYRIFYELFNILQARIDKAIEYLESYNTDFKNCRFGEAPISIRELGDLLDILKGSGKE